MDSKSHCALAQERRQDKNVELLWYQSDEHNCKAVQSTTPKPNQSPPSKSGGSTKLALDLEEGVWNTSMDCEESLKAVRIRTYLLPQRFWTSRRPLILSTKTSSFKILRNYGIPENITNAIEVLYSH